MIIQLGTLFSGLASGLGRIVQTAAPALLEVGGAFLTRELNRKLDRRTRQSQSAQAVQVLNTPGISVARVGGTIQPVGGRVQRSTFFPSAQTPAQSPFGNIPLLPVGTFPMDLPGAFEPFKRFAAGLNGTGGNMANGQGPLNLRFRVPGAPGEPRFAKDEMGKTVMFVPSPQGNGFITVAQSRNLFGSAMKPWWRFNRIESQFEKISPRRMNPFNFKATKRAGRRIERTLDAIKTVVSIQKKMDKGVSANGSIVKFKTKKKKKK